jgi:transcriptional regulator with PAS, ATPase and Fis domain
VLDDEPCTAGAARELPPQGILQLAVARTFQTLADETMGMIVLDRQHRIAWFSEGYRRFIALGPFADTGVIGRRIEDVVPNSLMGNVIDSGRAIPIDLLTNQYGSFLVSRMPLRDDDGVVVGGLSIVFLDRPETTMQPLLVKFSRLQHELDAVRRQLASERRSKYTIASFVGASPIAMEAKRHAWRVARTDSNVLLLGETGTGKELLAQGIHAASSRAGGPFVGVNVAAVPEALLEAEFFGVSAGAYTGADRKGREGKFKAADSGTLFLDEVGEMPLALQAKLLRVLQEREVEPLGGNRIQHVDVRIVAATSRNLAAMVAAGEFRSDLYYRLNVLPIRLPALRDRIADLEVLVEALGEEIAVKNGVPHKMLAVEAFELLAKQPWRGNVRELRNVLEQAILMTDDLVLSAHHFAFLDATAAARDARAEGVGAADRAVANASEPVPKTLPEVLADAQARAIRDALATTHGNKAAACRLLGISRAALYEKLAMLDR